MMMRMNRHFHWNKSTGIL